MVQTIELRVQIEFSVSHLIVKSQVFTIPGVSCLHIQLPYVLSVK